MCAEQRVGAHRGLHLGGAQRPMGRHGVREQTSQDPCRRLDLSVQTGARGEFQQEDNLGRFRSGSSAQQV